MGSSFRISFKFKLKHRNSGYKLPHLAIDSRRYIIHAVVLYLSESLHQLHTSCLVLRKLNGTVNVKASVHQEILVALSGQKKEIQTKCKEPSKHKPKASPASNMENMQQVLILYVNRREKPSQIRQEHAQVTYILPRSQTLPLTAQVARASRLPPPAQV